MGPVCGGRATIRVGLLAVLVVLALASAAGAVAAVPAAQSAAVRPVAIEFAAAHVNARIEARDVIDGVMQSPSGPLVVAWYTISSPLGERGNTMLYGFTDFPDFGPAAFYDLDEVEKGDELSVVGEDNRAYAYKVATVKTYDQQSVPLQELFNGTGGETVTLLADTEPWDEASQMYRKVIAIRATRTRAAPAPVEEATRMVSIAVACDIPPRQRPRARRPSANALIDRPTGAATPITITDRPAADKATLDRLTTTVRELTACINGGDQPRILAFFSDGFMRDDDARIMHDRDSDLIRAVAFAARPLVPEFAQPPLVVREAWMLPDGRLVATVETEGDTTPEDDYAFIAFVKSGDRWLIDEYDLPLARG